MAKKVRQAGDPPAVVMAKNQPNIDGWMNVLTGLGMALRDKARNNTFVTEDLTPEEGEELWRGDDMAAKVVEKPPDDMVREGIELRVQGEKALSEELDAQADELDVPAKLLEAMYWERACGGSALLIGADDGRDLKEPLDFDAIRRVEFLTVLSCRELMPAGWYGDLASKSYGQPRLFRLNQTYRGESEIEYQPRRPKGGRYDPSKFPLVHETRLVRFPGVTTGRRHMREKHGWGDSVLSRVNRVLQGFQMSFAGIDALIADFGQPVYKIKDLARLIAANETGTIQARIQIMDMMRSVLRALLLDTSEDFERKSTPVSGLAELVEKQCLRFAAAAGMPVSMVMGEAPAGLNATGDSDIRWYYDGINAKRETRLRPKVNYLFRALMAAREGPARGKVPKNWAAIFPSLWQMTRKEEAEIRKANAEADAAQVREGILTPEEVAMSRYGGDEYGDNIVLDMAARRAVAAAQAQEPEEEEDPEPTADPGRAGEVEGGAE